jgi:hypothetical protein
MSKKKKYPIVIKKDAEEHPFPEWIVEEDAARIKKKAARYGLNEDELLCMSKEELIKVLREKKKEQQRRYMHKWNAVNREKVAAKNRAWRAAHSEEAKANNRAWCAAHSEKKKTTYQAWYAAHREEVKTKGHAYRIANTEKVRANKRAYYIANREKILDKMHQYVIKNPEKIAAARRTHRKANLEKIRTKEHTWQKANPEKVRAMKHAWYVNNIKKIETARKANLPERAARKRQRRKEDIQYKLSECLRCRLRDALKGNRKTGSAVRDLGITIPELKIYLEAQFTESMSWENHGNTKTSWSIDHIRPLGEFDLTDPEQLKEACNWKNLRPLWHIENISRPKPTRSKTPNQKKE